MIEQTIHKSLREKRPGAPKSLQSFSELSELEPQKNLNSALNEEAVSKESKIKFKKSDIKFISRLGAGSSGSVNKVLHIPSDFIMACKVFFDLKVRRSNAMLRIRKIKRKSSCK
jgi:hypothetical protein